MIRTTFVLAATLLIVASCPAAERPNIVFIIADDLGWADVAFHGGNAPTPHLDQLAKNGLELTQHYVAPVCSPTRAGFLTGRCWSRFGVTTPTNELGLPADTVTLPRALKTKGFTSDNGGSTVENNDLKYPDDNCPSGRLTGNNKPRRAGKGAIYEGGTRVPTLVSWPSRAKPGRVDSPVQITDWMPTFCSLADYESNQDLKWDGTDVTRLLTDQAPLPNRPIYTVGPRWRSTSLRYGDWKLIAHQTGGDRRLELYNIAEDPSETKDVAKLNSKKTAELTARLEKAARADRDSVVK